MQPISRAMLFTLFFAVIFIANGSCAGGKNLAESRFSLRLLHPSTPAVSSDPFTEIDDGMAGYELLTEHAWSLSTDVPARYWVSRTRELTEDDLLDIAIEVDKIPAEFIIPGLLEPTSGEQVTIILKLNEAGTTKLKQLSERHDREKLAIVLDNEILSIPTIVGPIPCGSFAWSASLTRDEAEDIARRIRRYIVRGSN